MSSLILFSPITINSFYTQPGRHEEESSLHKVEEVEDVQEGDKEGVQIGGEELTYLIKKASQQEAMVVVQVEAEVGIGVQGEEPITSMQKANLLWVQHQQLQKAGIGVAVVTNYI